MKKLIYFIIFLMICLNAGTAQSVTSSTERKVPTLYGHTFPSMGQFRSSFINTSLQANLGFGITSPVRIPGIIIGDYEIFSFEGQILFINMDVQYQQRFTPWLALYMSFEMAGRMGTDMSTIMADGVNTLSGGEIGWMIRIMHNDKFNLSGTINLKNLNGNFINVTEYFKEIINNEPYPSVIKKVPAMTVGTGIQGAYAFNPTFGLQFQTNFAYGESFERKKTKTYVSGGVVGDVDFLPKHNTPIGLAIGYALSSNPAIVMREGGITHLISGKVGYTGSDDFELGVRYTYYNVKLKSVEEKPFVTTIMLMLKFYF